MRASPKHVECHEPRPHDGAAERSACANAGCAAKPIAATMAQTVARMIPPWQVNGTLEYSSAHRRRPDDCDRGRGAEEGARRHC